MIYRVCIGLILGTVLTGCAAALPIYGIGLVLDNIAGRMTDRTPGDCLLINREEYCKRSAGTVMSKLPLVEEEKETKDVKKIKDEKGCEWTPEKGGKWICPEKKKR